MPAARPAWTQSAHRAHRTRRAPWAHLPSPVGRHLWRRPRLTRPSTLAENGRKRPRRHLGRTRASLCQAVCGAGHSQGRHRWRLESRPRILERRARSHRRPGEGSERHGARPRPGRTGPGVRKRRLRQETQPAGLLCAVELRRHLLPQRLPHQPSVEGDIGQTAEYVRPYVPHDGVDGEEGGLTCRGGQHGGGVHRCTARLLGATAPRSRGARAEGRPREGRKGARGTSRERRCHWEVRRGGPALAGRPCPAAAVDEQRAQQVDDADDLGSGEEGDGLAEALAKASGRSCSRVSRSSVARLVCAAC